MTYFMPKKYDLTIVFSLHFTIWRLKNINSEALKKYVSNYYNASQMILAIAGNIEHSKVLELANKYFSSFKSVTMSL